ncbi:ras guanine nucleotide exchange factor domain-containing protein [Crucibulum laeve]|uniref:Ras guanine nucleotide exchange factor domain-containing protein n=1 Tax=Crucibulum laeve TaxID=68775 RepID=A0A5C3M544_9AGAR|nr:ras guanine nucleotide exchange factor domain-containing protein [Crucibulum laeve]
MIAGPSSSGLPSGGRQSRSPFYKSVAGPSNLTSRSRSISNASTSSSLSIISPNSASTNGSASSLHLPGNSYRRTRSRSVSPALDETVRLGPDYVLAMHDYAPESQNATCLSFRSGQVIHVLNRDGSGWWDGELDGRRGWFPSNYVSSHVSSLTEEEPPESHSFIRGHHYNQSTASATSWVSSASSRRSQYNRRSSISETLGSDIDSYCPPIMVPLLHGLSLLQNAVRSNRISHFQPSTACIISCVRSILAVTGTLQRDAPILQRFAALAEERRRILTMLASLVAQAKKASDESLEEEKLDLEIESMMRLGGQVFALVRRFLAVAVQCGVELPDESEAEESGVSPSDDRRWSQDENGDVRSSSEQTPTQHRQLSNRSPPSGSTLRMKSMGDIRHHIKHPTDGGTPYASNKGLATRTRQEQYLMRPSVLNRHKPTASVSSVSSADSYSSKDSAPPSSPPPFPCGPTTSARVMEALRFTHDHYLSTIAAFIGHAHSHSRTSHASSTGHLYDLVREIVEMVCKLLTIVEAVIRHPDVPTHRLGNLKAAKDGLYNVTNSLAESVRMLSLSLPSTMSDEEEKQVLLRSATGALKAGADCVAAVKVCLNRSMGERPFIIHLQNGQDGGLQPFTPSKFAPRGPLSKATSLSAIDGYRPNDEDLTIQAQTPSPPGAYRTRELSSSSEDSSKSSWRNSNETNVTSPDEGIVLTPLALSREEIEPDLPSPTSFARTDDGTTWEGSVRGHQPLEEKMIYGELPTVPIESMPELSQDPTTWMLGHDYSLEDVAYNSDGHLVGATMDVLVEKMTPHDSIVDPAFSAVFFMTFRLFSSPSELVKVLIARYNLIPPHGISYEDLQLWQQRKGIPVRLRVSNFIKLWVELYWRSGVDDSALATLTTFTREGLATLFPGPAQRIEDLLDMRRQATDHSISPKADRSRDPGMSINPPTTLSTSEIPRPSMTKTLLVALRKKEFSSISITDFDALELARQLTIMECNLYCSIQPEEILETGQEGATSPVNVRAVSSLSTIVTGWVAESILSEPDIKKRTFLVKFFVKVADRCVSLHNYSTSRSILAALDSSTISRLRQTWAGLAQKYKLRLEALRRLADHSRNYHEYRSKLRNTAPPAVPFLGLYLTDVTFCREGNPSHRASPVNASRKLLNFNKYHKLARIVQDMQRFQVPYNLKAIPEVQEYLNVAFENAKHHGDLQDLYNRSLLVEPKQPADTPPTGDMRQLFNWATRSQTTALS